MIKSRKTLIAWLIAVVVFNMSCLKDEYVSPQEQLDRDIKTIDAYLAENSINASAHDSGLRYQIHDPGTGAAPEDTDTITFNYEGRLMSNGHVFDQGDSAVYRLDQLIVGWRIGIPLIKEGGSITLYIPSGYGYGHVQSGDIPPNSNLIFDIDLVKVGGTAD